MGWTSGVWFLAAAGTFSLRRVQTGSEAYKATNPMGTKDSFPV